MDGWCRNKSDGKSMKLFVSQKLGRTGNGPPTMLCDMLKALKIFTAFACIVCFILNSFETFKKFFQGSKLVITSTQEHHDLPLPEIILCQESAFSDMDSEGIMRWSKEKYINQTIDPEEIGLKNLTLWSGGGEEKLYENYTKGYLNTMFNGRCLTINIHQKVSKVDQTL